MSGKVWVLQKHRRGFQAEPIQKGRLEGKRQQELVAEGSNKQEDQRRGKEFRTSPSQISKRQ
jgi:hypothetical protein